MGSWLFICGKWKSFTFSNVDVVIWPDFGDCNFGAQVFGHLDLRKGKRSICNEFDVVICS